VTRVRRHIGDADAVYNYWEPVHLLATEASAQRPVSAFETWEYAPQYAIRSWAYAALHAVVPSVLVRTPLPKVRRVSRLVTQYAAFYGARVALAAVSAGVDTLLYERVARAINVRVARYMLVFLTACAGPLVASVGGYFAR